MKQPNRYLAVCIGLVLWSTFTIDSSHAEVLVSDPAFSYGANQRDGSLMPTLTRSDNIVLIKFSSGSQSLTVRLDVEAPMGDTNQYAISFDIERDGDGDFWVWMGNPFARTALVADEDFQELGTIPFSLSPDHKSITFEISRQQVGPRPKAMVVSFDRSVSELQTPLFPVGEPIEMVQIDTNADELLLESAIAAGQAPDANCSAAGVSCMGLPFLFHQDAKECPPKGGEKVTRGDGDGDGRQDDWLYEDNTLTLRDPRTGAVLGRIEWWCLSREDNRRGDGTRFGKKVIHADGTQGWIAQCPYEGGEQIQDVRYAADRITPTAIEHRVSDLGKRDDDGDGAKDSMYYRYDLNSREHIGAHYENGFLQVGEESTHPNPHANFGDVEFWP